MNPLTDMTGAEIAAAVKAGKLTARSVAEAALARTEKLNPVLNGFTAITSQRALAKADAVDADIAAGRDPGPLAGVPFAVKNLFDVKGLPTLAGSKINRDLPPAGDDAALVKRMEAAGAVLTGALNMGEYAYDFTGQNAHDGASRNPHDPEHMSGGSSGGSGTATAAGMASITLGSDTNGSIRVPSSFCGLFGLKPTYGRLTRAGTFPFVSSLDHLGPIARSTADLALAYDAMQGPDPDDPGCAGRNAGSDEAAQFPRGPGDGGNGIAHIELHDFVRVDEGGLQSGDLTLAPSGSVLTIAGDFQQDETAALLALRASGGADILSRLIGDLPNLVHTPGEESFVYGLPADDLLVVHAGLELPVGTEGTYFTPGAR